MENLEFGKNKLNPGVPPYKKNGGVHHTLGDSPLESLWKYRLHWAAAH